MGGKLNAATYFSTFANVSNKNMATLGGNNGYKKATWQSWKFSDRIKKAKATVDFSTRIESQEVTTFSAKQESRQEFEPPLGKFIDKAKVEPLHTSNNAWQHLFLQIFVRAMKQPKQEVLKRQKVLKSCQARVLSKSLLLA